MELYKYCDENAVDILRNKRLKISSIDSFNDPFEFRVSYEGENKNLKNALETVYQYQKRNYRVVSFTDVYNNLILWAHYANNHKGMLIKFDLDKIKDNNGLTFSETTLEAIYTEDRIRFPDEIDTDSKEIKELVPKVNYTKFKDWGYEKEYRTLLKYDWDEDVPYIPIVPDAITEVILGLNCSWETELLVKTLLKETEYSHVALKKAEIDDYKFQMFYKDIEL